MTNKKDPRVDAAAFVYIRSCLMGRAYRFRKRLTQKAQRELTVLNEPMSQNEDGIDRLSLVASSDSRYDPNCVAERMTLQNAMQYLTANERRIITALYFDGETVVTLCETLRISKNSVLKTKRKALRKMRITLQKIVSAAEEEKS
ncbi:hypothetical protein JZ785_06750 [Alicyclobacillus curvatus]|nr:hypothetical protein JZ785_06750 [Alicyclobacillus curvatus]